MTDFAASMFAPLGEEERHAPPPPQDDGTADWEPIEPIPADAPEPPKAHPRLGEPSRRWAYRAADGGLSGYVCRYETVTPEGRPDKEFRPLRWGRLNGRLGWHWRGWGEGRPLYRLPELLAKPGAVALVTEGEKKADAAAYMLPDLVATAPMNGARSPARTDWTPMRGRTVVIATDNDEAGLAFGDAVAALCRAAGARAVMWLPPDRFGAWLPGDGGLVPREGGMPEGYDLADALEEGWTAELVQELRTDPAFFGPYLDAAERAEARQWAEEMDGAGHPAGDAAAGGQRRGHDWPFRLDPEGVRRRIECENKQTGQIEVEWRWFCSRLEVEAETRDADGESWGRLLIVTDRDGRGHEWALPMEMLAGSGEEYRRRLLSLGLVMAPGKFARDALHEYLSTAWPRAKARCVVRIGWHGRAFVLPDATLGDCQGERVLLQTLGPFDHAYRARGTLGDWRERVARPAAGNSRVAFCLSAAFAPPLLQLVGAESGGFHLRGGSSIGKSTVLVAAGSAWGGGGLRGYLRQWRATDNGLEAVAQAHSDALLCLDELSQIDARAAGAAAYMLANGAGKSRAGRGGEGRPAAEWRVLFLSNGEIGLADKLAEDGRGRRIAAGQQVRVIDIPADAGVELGLFENLHGFDSADAFARHLKQASCECYGTAARAFIAEVAADLEGAQEAIAGFAAEFVADHCPAGADGQVSRVAARFGLVAAAGELATALGILPWERGEAAEAAATCFRAWLDERGGVEPAEVTAGIALVRRFIELHGESRFTPWDTSGTDGDRPTVNRAGFRRPDNQGGVEYYVLPQVWRSEVCGGCDPGMVARALMARRLLIPDGDGKPQSRHRLPGSSGPVRCYRLAAGILGGDEHA